MQCQNCCCNDIDAGGLRERSVQRCKSCMTQLRVPACEQEILISSFSSHSRRKSIITYVTYQCCCQLIGLEQSSQLQACWLQLNSIWDKTQISLPRWLEASKWAVCLCNRQLTVQTLCMPGPCHWVSRLHRTAQHKVCMRAQHDDLGAPWAGS